jgi:hypothetical protein
MLRTGTKLFYIPSDALMYQAILYVLLFKYIQNELVLKPCNLFFNRIYRRAVCFVNII